MHRPDHREGSFVIAYDEMMVIHDRMAENAVQFAQSLHQMHDDLVELATVAERNRKGWKTNALAAEQKVADLEAAMRKSKTKYDSLADEYDRARTGEGRQGGRVLGAFKQKSAAQVEEDLLRKVQMADQTYHGAVLALQGDKSALESSTRPEAVRALQDIAKETDAGLLLQMQKFGKTGGSHDRLCEMHTNLIGSCFQREVAAEQRSRSQSDEGTKRRAEWPELAPDCAWGQQRPGPKQLRILLSQHD